MAIQPLRRLRVLCEPFASSALNRFLSLNCIGGLGQMAFGDLTTLADVKAWLQTGQNPFPATDDALLSRLIAAASEFVQNWLGRQIAAADWLEMRDGTGGQLLAFANIPVTAILSLSIDGLMIPPASADGGFGAGYIFTPTELALRGC